MPTARNITCSRMMKETNAALIAGISKKAYPIAPTPIKANINSDATKTKPMSRGVANCSNSVSYTHLTLPTKA